MNYRPHWNSDLKFYHRNHPPKLMKIQNVFQKSSSICKTLCNCNCIYTVCTHHFLQWYCFICLHRDTRCLLLHIHHHTVKGARHLWYALQQRIQFLASTLQSLRSLSTKAFKVKTRQRWQIQFHCMSTLLKLQPNTAWCCHKRHSHTFVTVSGYIWFWWNTNLFDESSVFKWNLVKDKRATYSLSTSFI